MNANLYLILSLILLHISVGLSGQTDYFVNSTNDLDDGICDAAHCSLREAINAANSDGMASNIMFAIPGGNTETIFLDNVLPPLEESDVQILGSSQTGIKGGIRINCGNIGPQIEDILSIWSDNSLVEGLEIFNYTVSEGGGVEGAGSLIGVGSQWLPKSPADVTVEFCNLHSTFRARMDAENYANGIDVHSGENIIVRGLTIGMNWNQDLPLPVYGNGIRVDEDNFGEVIIGNFRDNVDHINVIGNCLRGIFCAGGDGLVVGNVVGTNLNETEIFGNRDHGILVLGSSEFFVGGPQPFLGNVCANNVNNGIHVASSFSLDISENRVYNNTIGIFADDVGNAGVYIDHNTCYQNTQDGIMTVLLATSTNVTISENSTYCNNRGIGVGIRAPVSPFRPIRVNAFDATMVLGEANPGALIELFEHDDFDCPGAFCQGRTYIGNVVTDATGVWNYIGPLTPGKTYTMTQTLTNGNTSPFGPCFTIPGCVTVVTNTADAGPGSLRSAIICANSSPEGDTITFDIPGPGPHLIIPQTPLPDITDEIIMIDGSSQPGNFPMNERIIIDGVRLNINQSGFRFEPNPNGIREVFGLVFRQFQGNAIFPVECSIFRLGAVDRGNVINGCGSGVISFGIDFADFKSNYFGTNMALNQGIENINNFNGIIRTGIIGGSIAAGQSNVIASATNEGFQITLADNYDIRIEGNYIGVDMTGTTPIGSTIPTGFGINLSEINGFTNGRIIVGGNDDRSNTFAYNRRALQTSALHCKFTNNSFYCNTVEAINLTAFGNAMKSAPDITMANLSSIAGSSEPLDSVEVFLDPKDCPDQPCQGKILLGKAHADNSGSWVLNAPFSFGIVEGNVVTALATDQEGNTSEFSSCVEICPQVTIVASNGGPYCQGDIIELFSNVNHNGNQVIYRWSGPNGYNSNDQNPIDASQEGIYTLQVSVDGCDYEEVETEVTIYSNDTVRIDTTLCQGEFIIINGSIYDETRASGTEFLKNKNDCDSTIFINVAFEEVSQMIFDQTLCAEDFIIVNNVRYDINNPSGTDTLTKRNGCDSIFQINLIFRSPIEINFNRTLCFGQSLIVNGVTYDENNPSGTEILTTPFGCDSIINIQLTFDDVTIYTLDTTVCVGEFVNINGKIYDQSNPTGSDTIVMGSSSGCDSVINISLNFENHVVYSIDTVLCPGQDLRINGRLYDRFNPSGQDTLFGAAASGCDSIINIKVSYPDPQVSFDTIQPNCSGIADGQIIITSIDNITGPFQFSVNGSRPQNLPTIPYAITGLDQGAYDIIITDGKGCNYLYQLNLDGGAGGISISTIGEVEINLGDSVSLSFNANFIPDSIVWSPSTDLSCTNCPDPVASPSEDRTYMVTVYLDGCQTSAEIIVRVTSSVNVFVPNIFSPDGNGINDHFNVFAGKNVIKVNYLRVFNRWGELIYQGVDLDPSDNSSGWDGTYRGENVMPGVYVYHLQVELSNGSIAEFSGDLTVIR